MQPEIGVEKFTGSGHGADPETTKIKIESYISFELHFRNCLKFPMRY